MGGAQWQRRALAIGVGRGHKTVGGAQCQGVSLAIWVEPRGRGGASEIMGGASGGRGHGSVGGAWGQGRGQ